MAPGALALRVAVAAPLAALVTALLGGCTTESADRAARGATSTVATAQPDPGMTFIEAAPRCATTRPLTGRGRVPLDAVFPGAETSAFSAPKEAVPGPDATDRTRCPGELPSRPHCDSLLPWTDLPPDAFVTASRARRVVEGYLLTMPKQAGNQAPPESSAGTKVVSFSLVDLPADDRGGLVAYLETAFTTCAKATSSRAAGVAAGVPSGVAARIGTVPSEYGAGSAEAVLLRRGPHLVWATLDGSGWRPGEQQKALGVLVSRLL